MKTDRMLVWDLPVRVFHWLLAGAFALAWLTAESERWRDIHVLAGYTMLALVAFRIVWGFVGSRYARFSSFAAGPGRVARYLKSVVRMTPEHHVGHNPAGAWAIFGLLALTVATAASGHVAYNDPGAHWLEELHEGAAVLMLGLVAVHVAGVVVASLLHRENLVGSMITGTKASAPEGGIRRPHRIVAALLAIAVAGIWIAGLGDGASEPSTPVMATRSADRHERGH